MKDFWKNEWSLFLEDMRQLGEFCMQPVEITGIPWRKADPMLNASVEEAEARASEGGFWANQWDMFKNEMQNAREFLTQPVEFK